MKRQFKYKRKINDTIIKTQKKKSYINQWDERILFFS